MAASLLGHWAMATPDGGTCQVRVGRSVATAEELIPTGHETVAILTQPSVVGIASSLARDAESQLGLQAHVLTLPDGDSAKDMSVVADVYEQLNQLGFTRGDLIVGVGGGALTDSAGFVAATYLRGVAVSYLATTLLGAVDAAIGGKTGVNVGGKNLAGVFRHPARVIVDIDILEDLPARLLREGAAETVKAGFIADASIVSAYEDHGLRAPLDVVVPAAIAVKVQTVDADFREHGMRAILNYGHTVGHAVEVAAGISHGDAVAIGMVAAGKISEALVGFTEADRQREIIRRIGLPVVAPAVDGSDIDRLMSRDKKRDADGLRMVLLEDFGKPVVRHVDPEAVEVGLAEIGVVR